MLAAAGTTAWLVAGAVGPAIFHEHLRGEQVATAEDALFHAEEAFRTAGALALLIALGAAVAAALAVSVFLTRRIGASLRALTAAAHLVADGRSAVEVPSPNLGAEFSELVEAFNHMATRLEASEELRHRLLSDVAHELRTPVATLNAYLEGLEDGVAELDPDTIALLREQGARLTRLAEDLAAVTRAEGGDLGLSLEPRDPAELVRAAHLAARDRAEATGVELSVVAPAGLPAVLVDKDRIAQVLGNLLDNAIRHTRPGGAVILEAAAAGGGVTLSVTDTGDGIDPRDLPHVFERFYRAGSARDRASGGSGIGLAITKALVEAHGGTVEATSAGRGRGSRFDVTLPVAGPDAPVR